MSEAEAAVGIVAPALPVQSNVSGNGAFNAEPKQKRKRSRKAESPAPTAPHVTGRVLHVEVSAAGVAFAVKGKKGKAEALDLNGFEATAVPAATALIASAAASKAKLRVEYATSSDMRRVVTKLRVKG